MQAWGRGGDGGGGVGAVPRGYPALCLCARRPAPTRDPDGRLYGQHTEPVASFSEQDWHDFEAYLDGIDLFNHRYWWEAHEALEAV